MLCESSRHRYVALVRACSLFFFDARGIVIVITVKSLHSLPSALHPTAAIATINAVVTTVASAVAVAAAVVAAAVAVT